MALCGGVYMIMKFCIGLHLSTLATRRVEKSPTYINAFFKKIPCMLSWDI
jgi:hypothetical protein